MRLPTNFPSRTIKWGESEPIGTDEAHQTEGEKCRSAHDCPRPAARAGDEGFTLIEVVVALVLTVVVMTTTAGFFIRAVGATRLMQQRQGAVAVAELAMERVRAEPFAAMTIARDVTSSGATDPAYRVSNIDYRVRTTINSCGLPPSGGVCGVSTSSPNLVMYRVNITVQWTPGPMVQCASPGGVCEYTVTGLRDASLRSVENLTEVAP